MPWKLVIPCCAVCIPALFLLPAAHSYRYGSTCLLPISCWCIRSLHFHVIHVLSFYSCLHEIKFLFLVYTKSLATASFSISESIRSSALYPSMVSSHLRFIPTMIHRPRRCNDYCFYSSWFNCAFYLLLPPKSLLPLVLLLLPYTELIHSGHYQEHNMPKSQHS